MKDKQFIIVAGIIAGAAAVVLVLLGNPANMGFCIACFIRDTTGALGLHRAGVVQYIRPEIIGLMLGAFLSALGYREFKAGGGSSTALRFFLGAAMMMGALIFLGCPWRLLLRMAGGDLNALIAFPGYILGIWVGVFFLKRGYSLGQATEQTKINGYSGPFMAIALLILLLAAPAFIFFSEEGPGSMQAPLWIALAIGLLIGYLAQRTRLCTMGAFRDLILFRDFHLFSGVASLFIVALLGNLFTGNFNPGMAGQPVAHTDGVWNFLGMGIVGFAAVLAGGCPLRQLILAGEGNTDATGTVLGMVFGAAIMHNFGWAASPAGVSPGGQAMVIVLWLLLLGFAYIVVKQQRVMEEAKRTVTKSASSQLPV